MKIHRSLRTISRPIRALSGVITTFGLLSVAACGGAGTETAGADPSEDSLATQEQGLTKESDDNAPDEPLPLSAPDVARRVTPVADVPVRQATLDLGIEPARGSRS